MAINKVQAITMTSKNSATLTGGYDLVVTSLAEACFMIRIVNASNRIVNISYNGTNLHDVLPANTSTTINFQASSLPRSNIALLPKGQKIWLNGTAGVGNIYIVGYYVG